MITELEQSIHSETEVSDLADKLVVLRDSVYSAEHGLGGMANAALDAHHALKHSLPLYGYLVGVEDYGQRGHLTNGRILVQGRIANLPPEELETVKQQSDA